MRAEWISKAPQWRYVSPDEIFSPALFLLADTKASFATGHILNVDGGFAASGYLPVRASPQPVAAAARSALGLQDLSTSLCNSY